MLFRVFGLSLVLLFATVTADVCCTCTQVFFMPDKVDKPPLHHHDEVDGE